MGISLFSSSSFTPEVSKNRLTKISGDARSLPNPDPENYTIGMSYQQGNCLAVEVTYHDCINYEGRKILVYEGCTLRQLQEQKYINPHFCEDKKFHSPIARFEPTRRGWNLAIGLVNQLKS